MHQITPEAFDVARCFEPNINPGAIDTLVMPAPRKQMIKALVQKFTDPKDSLATSWRADFIENKGEGQIFLLHGGPGVGKTYVSWASVHFRELTNNKQCLVSDRRMYCRIHESSTALPHLWRYRHQRNQNGAAALKVVQTC